MNTQRVSHKQQVAELHLLPRLHALDRRPVDTGLVREGLLGEALVQASDADAVADCTAGRGDPLGQIGWHTANRLPIMIISQQQI